MRVMTTGLLLLIFSGALPEANALTEDFVPRPWDYFFYTFSLVGVAFATLIILSYKEYQWLLYSALSVALIINGAALDGTLAYSLGVSDFVLWVIPFLSTMGVTCFGFLIIAWRLEPPHTLAKFKRGFYGLSFFSGLLLVSTFFWLGKIPLSTMWIPANVLFFSMVVGQILPPLTWPSYDRRLNVMIRLFPVVAALLAIGGYWRFAVSDSTTQNDFNNLYRWMLLLFAFFSLTIVIWQSFNKNRAREAAERQAIEAAKKEAEMQLALLEVDKAYNQALSVAEKHQKQLATVSHDLKQPVVALRSVVDQLRRNKKNDDAERLSKAVDYIDSLTHSYLSNEDSAGSAPKTSVNEIVKTSVFANALAQMFEGDSSQKNIELRFVAMNHSILVEPLSTMRIMTNLISNAIAHAGASRILVGFRRRKDQVIFQVHDNGCGITKELQATFMASGEKGEMSDGHGLGLGIVRELCRAQDMLFTLKSEKGKGTSAFVAMERSTHSR